MLNSKPNNPSKYDQGNFIPNNKDKVLKLNSNGGIYYRSSIEKRIMIWLDNKKEILKWGAENIKIPYQLLHIENGISKLKEHSYYPDIYYEIKSGDKRKTVLVEVKPSKEYQDVILFQKGQFKIDENLSVKKLRNLEYRFKAAQKNSEKWKAAIKWCEKKGYKFAVVTEKHL